MKRTVFGSRADIPSVQMPDYIADKLGNYLAVREILEPVHGHDVAMLRTARYVVEKALFEAVPTKWGQEGDVRTIESRAHIFTDPFEDTVHDLGTDVQSQEEWINAYSMIREINKVLYPQYERVITTPNQRNQAPGMIVSADYIDDEAKALFDRLAGATYPLIYYINLGHHVLLRELPEFGFELRPMPDTDYNYVEESIVYQRSEGAGPRVRPVLYDKKNFLKVLASSDGVFGPC